MAIKVQSSFAAGELDPALHERTTLDKYKSGLATARNVIIGKTGRVISRPGRKRFRACKSAQTYVRLYSPPNSGVVLEWGHLYVRVYGYEVVGYSSTFDDDGYYAGEFAHAMTSTNLQTAKFVTSGMYVYVFVGGVLTLKLYYGIDGPAFVSAASIFVLPDKPTSPTCTAHGTTGYYVDYAITKIVSGEETNYTTILGGSTYKLPINAGESNTIVVCVQTGTADHDISEIRVYRRPQGAGAYGYIGSSSAITSSGGNIIGTFEDVGASADYTHTPPTPVRNFDYRGGTDAEVLLSYAGTIYQQRLLMVDSSGDPEAIAASRPGYQNNFWRDYPISADSSMYFKSGTSGRAAVLNMIDSDGLVVFTTIGIYLHLGAITPTNLSLDKKGNWVIKEDVPPLAIPGGVLFVDKATNTVRNLTWSTEQASYAGEELSIFSNHLFSARSVTAWGFLDGEFPLLWVVFDDGEFASFTFEREHEMRAWTRHDSFMTVEDVAGSGVPELTWFLTEKDGTFYIERTVPRLASASDLEDDPEADKGESIAFMDSFVTFKTILNYSLSGVDFIALDLITNHLTCGTSGLFTVGTYGAVGTILRYFDTEDGTSIDLEVVARISDNEVRVELSSEFPSDQASDMRVYATFNTITDSVMSHLSGESVAVIVDGYVVASPNNDIDDYDDVMVESNTLTLPNGLRGAIIHVGFPITADVETLDIDTVEQRPTLIESLTVNKMYIKVLNSGGLYASNSFPADDKVEGMQELDSMTVDYEEDEDGYLLGNRYEAPKTKRIEASLRGDWKSQGKICIRQVDPLHFEILSIIPDLEDLRR